MVTMMLAGVQAVGLQSQDPAKLQFELKELHGFCCHLHTLGSVVPGEPCNTSELHVHTF